MGRETVVDLYGGGLGGWCRALRSLDLDAVGIELDDDACATRRAAGLPTVQADVALLDPLAFGPIVGLCGGPPCQPFSQAGKGAGRDAMTYYVDAIYRIASGQTIDRAELDAACGDPRAHHVLEPLRWALALRPRWVALEQVETVLPVWQALARALRHHGYRTWAGVVSCETYGVPQTRRRALLLASLDVQPRQPPATHARYVAPREAALERKARDTDALDLVDAGRIVVPADAGLLPWVSMGEALGWPEELILRNGKNTMTSSRDSQDMEVYERPLSAPAPTLDTHASRWKVAPDGAHVDPPHRWKLSKADDRSRRAREGEARNQPRPIDAPAQTIDTRADLMRWRLDSRGQRDGRTGRPNRERDISEPANTIAGESRNDRFVLRMGDRHNATIRPLDEPASTLVFGKTAGNLAAWIYTRPATTVCGDDRLHPPGHKVNAADVEAGREYDGRAGVHAINLTVEQALTLQGFPPDVVIVGNKTEVFRQIGNAMPPALGVAAAVEVTRRGSIEDVSRPPADLLMATVQLDLFAAGAGA